MDSPEMTTFFSNLITVCNRLAPILNGMPETGAEKLAGMMLSIALSNYASSGRHEGREFVENLAHNVCNMLDDYIEHVGEIPIDQVPVQ